VNFFSKKREKTLKKAKDTVFLPCFRKSIIYFCKIMAGNGAS